MPLIVMSVLVIELISQFVLVQKELLKIKPWNVFNVPPNVPLVLTPLKIVPNVPEKEPQYQLVQFHLQPSNPLKSLITQSDLPKL